MLTIPSIVILNEVKDLLKNSFSPNTTPKESKNLRESSFGFFIVLSSRQPDSSLRCRSLPTSFQTITHVPDFGFGAARISSAI